MQQQMDITTPVHIDEQSQKEPENTTLYEMIYI